MKIQQTKIVCLLFSNPICAFLCKRQRIQRNGTNAKKGIVITMDATGELLCGVYKNVKMASENIVSVLPKVQDKFLIGELTAHLDGYSSMAHNIENMMHERGIEPTPPGMLSKIGAAAGVALNTMINKTPSRIARLYMMETREAARRLEHMCDEVSLGCDAHVMGVCREIIEKERQNSEKMEAFI